MITCTREFGIDAGHRLQRHESKCKNLHGHRYRFVVTVTAPGLDDVGRVIDFSVLKDVIGAWLDQFWDHGFIVEKSDPIREALERDHSKIFVMEFSPTAENLARYLWGICALRLPAPIVPVEVVCWETPSCSATYRP